MSRTNVLLILFPVIYFYCKGVNKMKTNEIKMTLRQFGIFPHYKGYFYLTGMIELYMKGEIAAGHLTKLGYPKVAKINKTSASAVERGCRSAIHGSYHKFSEVYATRLLFKEVPTNSMFICSIAEYLIDQEEKREES